MTTERVERPRLGEFSKPVAPRARQSVVDPTDNIPKTAPAPADKEQKEEELLQQVEAKETDGEREAMNRLSLYEEMQQALLPVQDYKKFLKDHNISESEAGEIVDNLLTKGYHEETVSISRRISITIRTREHRDLLRLQTVAQAQPPLFQNMMDELTTRHNMAASLVEINGKRFDHPTPETADKEADELFDKRMVYVERMPAPLFTKVSIKLANFDRKIAAVMREGVAENF